MSSAALVNFRGTIDAMPASIPMTTLVGLLVVALLGWAVAGRRF
jgi:hypothetical protein